MGGPHERDALMEATRGTSSLTEQIYLLLLAFLKSRGHHQMARWLLEDCERTNIISPRPNWQGTLVPANFGNFVSNGVTSLADQSLD